MGVSKPQRELALKAFAKGMSPMEVSERYDYSIDQAYAIRRAAVKLYGAEAVPKLRGFRPEIEELHKQGMSDTDIALRLGVSQQAVSQLRARMGLVSNGKKGTPDWFLPKTKDSRPAKTA